MGFRRFFHRNNEDTDLARELEAHITHQVDENISAGMSEEEARRQAYLKLGSPQHVREDVWEWNTVGFFDNLVRDLRYALRMLRRSPGFSALAILCLTLGIGANAAAFSWIEGTLFRPYPAVAHPDQLLVLSGTVRGGDDYAPLSWPDFVDLRRNCTLIDSFIAEKITGATLAIGNRAEGAVGSMVSTNYFDALGVHPILGRGFSPEEETGRNAHPVTVISYWMWKQRYHSDPEIIGKQQVLNQVPYTIVGVAPENFYGTFVGYAWQFWVPVSMQEKFETTGYQLEDRSARWIEGFVRLKPGVSRAQAQQEISAAASRLEADFPATNRGRGIQLLALWESPFNSSKVLLPTLGVTLAVVFLVLLIACANVSNLLLVRAFARRHEMTVRMAVGARRSRLLRQLITEGLILALWGAAAGLAAAYWCRNLLVLIIPFRSAPLYLPGSIDWRVLALSVGISLFSTMLFALAPALQASKVDLATSLKSESTSVVGGSGRAGLRSVMVLVQVSLSFVLLAGAGLVFKSLRAVRNTSPGFSTQGVLLTGVNLLGAGYDAQRARNFQDQLMESVQAIQGIESAAYARIAPFSYREYSSDKISVDGYQAAPDEQLETQYNEVGPGYFRTLGIPLVSGREFLPSDDQNADLVAVVNESLAARYWHGQDPLGKRLGVGDKTMRVVGVARNAKYRNMLEDPKPFFYVPLRQNGSTLVILNLRTHQDPGVVATAVARELHRLDPGISASEVITIEEQMERQTSAQQVAVVLLGVFGGLALLLAAIGLYGVVSYAVSQSTRELALRMALGARASDVLRLVMTRGMVLTAAGLALGLVASLGLSGLIGSLLYKVKPWDPGSFALAFVIMAVVAGAASFLPALRAAQTDPVSALHE